MLILVFFAFQFLVLRNKRWTNGPTGNIMAMPLFSLCTSSDKNCTSSLINKKIINFDRKRKRWLIAIDYWLTGGAIDRFFSSHVTILSCAFSFLKGNYYGSYVALPLLLTVYVLLCLYFLANKMMLMTRMMIDWFIGWYNVVSGGCRLAVQHQSDVSCRRQQGACEWTWPTVRLTGHVPERFTRRNTRCRAWPSYRPCPWT